MSRFIDAFRGSVADSQSSEQPISEFIDAFQSESPATRRLLLAQMSLTHTDPELRELRRVLSELHEKLIEIHGDTDG